MRNLNQIQRNKRYSEQSFVMPSPQYLTSDGQKTLNMEEAVLDSFGSPSSCGYNYEVCIPHSIYSLPRPFSFNPNDPSARALAFEARSAFDGLVSSPVDYTDKFAAISYANNVSSILFPKVQALKDSLSNPKNV